MYFATINFVFMTMTLNVVINLPPGFSTFRCHWHLTKLLLISTPDPCTWTFSHIRTIFNTKQSIVILNKIHHSQDIQTIVMRTRACFDRQTGCINIFQIKKIKIKVKGRINYWLLSLNVAEAYTQKEFIWIYSINFFVLWHY